MDMRITGAYGVYGAQPVKKTTSVTSVRSGVRANAIDSVSFSAAANELNAARRAIREVPDIRSERVIALREQLNSGSYQVTASDIAAKIFGVDA